MPARHDLTAAVRALAEATLLAEPGAITDEVVARVRALAGEVAALPRVGATAGTADPTIAERSPYSGASNATAPPVVFTSPPGAAITAAEAVFGALYEGPPGRVHGGVQAGVFDEMVTIAQMVSGQPGYTGTLTVRYEAPMPLFVPVSFTAGVDRVEGRKVFIRSQATVGGAVVARCEAVCIAPRDGMPPAQVRPAAR